MLLCNLNIFFYRSHNRWTSFPLELREIRESSIFKFKLKEHLWKLAIEEVTVDDSDSSMSDTRDSNT